MSVNFNLYGVFLELIDKGYSCSEIASILNLYEIKTSNILREAREYLIDKFDDESFGIIEKIDVANKRKEQHTKYSEVISLIECGNPIEVIQLYLKTDIYGLLHTLKEAYYYMGKHGKKRPESKQKSLLRVINDVEKSIESRENLGRKNYHITPVEKRAMIGKKSYKLKESSAPVRTICDFGPLDSLRALFLADSHLGSDDENYKYLDTAYDYASKHGIDKVILAGDVLQGNVSGYSRCKSDMCDPYKQIDSFLKKYPFDKNIITYILLGNHDASLLYNSDVDVNDYLEFRDDFVSLGYRHAFLKVGNDYIGVKHDVPLLFNAVKEEKGIIDFYGHSHFYDIERRRDGGMDVKIPTISDQSPGENHSTVKGFLDGSFVSTNGYIKDINVDMVSLNEKVTLALKK